MSAVPADPPLSVLRIGADATEITAATGWLAALAEEGDWPEATRFALELSLEEALANVVMHGFKAVSHAPEIRLEYRAAGDGRIAVTVVDNGIAFDPTTAPEPVAPSSIEEARIGGHGVQLMRRFLESLSYARADGENRLTLVASPAKDF